ncbi:hypothetical protein ACI77J_11975 [Pseudomonas sp. O64]
MTPQFLSGKPLRILIADQYCAQREAIERDLSKLGYWRVAPVDCFEDLITLTHYSPNAFERFDLVVISAELLLNAGINALDFCRDNPRLRHVLIYDPSREERIPKTFSERSAQRVRVIRMIDRRQLMDFLSLIDPAFDLLPAKVG